MVMKKLVLAAAAAVLTVGITMTAFAAGWQQDGNGWWYEREDGSYPANAWEEIGGQWYYFNGYGYMLSDCWVGDYYLGSSGAMLRDTWIGAYYVGPDGKWVPDANAGNVLSFDGIPAATGVNDGFYSADLVDPNGEYQTGFPVFGGYISGSELKICGLLDYIGRYPAPEYSGTYIYTFKFDSRSVFYMSSGSDENGQDYPVPVTEFLDVLNSHNGLGVTINVVNDVIQETHFIS